MMSPASSTELRHDKAVNERALFGFWVYLMTDLLMFAVLFAVYAVLHGNTVGGPGGSDLFSPRLALAETIILLTSSLTCGIAMLSARDGQQRRTLFWFGVTFVLGLLFLTLELREFRSFILEGHTMRTNAFLSSFFVLVGTHGLHILSGLLWMAIMLLFVRKRGLNPSNLRKLSMLSLYWHFLDIVWVFIFTVVYLMAFTGLR